MCESEIRMNDQKTRAVQPPLKATDMTTRRRKGPTRGVWRPARASKGKHDLTARKGACRACAVVVICFSLVAVVSRGKSSVAYALKPPTESNRFDAYDSWRREGKEQTK
jgi:hypothetical protein